MSTLFSRRRLPFAAVLAACFLAGAAFRLAPGLGSDTPASSAGSSSDDYVVISAGPPPVARPKSPLARAVVDFYQAVIEGRYDTAYRLSTENVWSPGGSARVVGLQSRDHFVEALRDEIGPDGLPVGIGSLSVSWQRPLPVTDTAREQLPELAALRFLPASARVWEAHVRGNLVGNCRIANFDRTDVVVDVDGRWKVLLPGRERAKGAHWEEWFLTRSEALTV